MKIGIFVIASVFLFGDATAAFTTHQGLLSTRFALLPRRHCNDPSRKVDVTRSMVAMEPKRSTGNEGELDRNEPPMRIIKPEELMRSEMRGENSTDDRVADQNQSHYMDPVELHGISATMDDTDDEDGDGDGDGDATEVEAKEANVETPEVEAQEAKANVDIPEVEAEEEKETEVATLEEEVTEVATLEEEKDLKAESEPEDDPAEVSITVAGEAGTTIDAHNVLFRIINRALGPVFGRAIQKGVQKNTIKGAWISGLVVSMMAGLDPISSSLFGTGLSYISITQGVGGDVVRATGEAAWETALIGVRVTRNIFKAFGLNFEQPVSATSIVANGDISSPESNSVVDEDIAKLVEEVEQTVAEVESVLESSNQARDAIAEEEAQVAEADRLSEEARLAEIEYLMEEAKIEKEARQAEEEFLAEEARIEEEERLAEIARLEEEEQLALLKLRIEEDERLAEEERLAEMALIEEEEERMASEEARLYEEESRLAEEEILAEEARVAEEEKQAEEELLAEEARVAEEQKLAEKVKEDEEEIIDDAEWEASIQLAEDIEVTEERDNWNSARQLAKDLADEDEEEIENVAIDFNDPSLSDSARMDLIAEAARAAVEKFEADRREVEEEELLEKSRRNEMKMDLTKANVNGLSVESIPTEKANSELLKDVTQTAEIDQPNYKKMTVKQLKETLRSKGLKVSGKKAELIERLQSS